MGYIKNIILIIVIAVYIPHLCADEQDIGIDEKLGQNIPLNLSFLDETGKPVTLKELFGKPVILTLVYYRCSGICSPLLSGVADVVDRLDMDLGKDYNIVTISFDPEDDYMTAAEKKRNYLDNMKKKVPAGSWHFLTSDSISAAAITDAIGFRYKKRDDQYVHSAIITVLSPDGKIARYLYGIDFLPLDVKLALTEASEGKSGPTINKFLKLCFSYDPEGKRYALNITRIAGGITLIMIAGFFIVLTLKKKIHHNNPSVNGEGSVKNG